MRKQNGMPTKAAWQKLQIFKIQDGGRPPFWKSLYRHISVKNRPILMKFGIFHQILNLVTVTWPKIEIFEIQDGGGRHLENRFFLAITHQPIVRFHRNFVWGSRTACCQGLRVKKCKCVKSKMADGRHLKINLNRYISVKNCPILMKFGTLHQILNPVTVTWPKINSRWRRPPSWKLFFFGHNSLTDCPISAKFCLRKQNGMPTKATWHKLQIFKNQDFENRYIAISQWKIVRF